MKLVSFHIVNNRLWIQNLPMEHLPPIASQPSTVDKLQLAVECTYKVNGMIVPVHV